MQVAFLRVDTQTILTIAETIITRSARGTVRHSIDKDERLSTRQRKTWQLSLKDVTQADNGAYMCQLNIENLVSQVAYLHVTGMRCGPPRVSNCCNLASESIPTRKRAVRDFRLCILNLTKKKNDQFSKCSGRSSKCTD